MAETVQKFKSSSPKGKRKIKLVMKETVLTKETIENEKTCENNIENDIENELALLVKTMRMKESDSEKEKILEKIKSMTSFTHKCIYARQFLPPQSTDMEAIIKNDLDIGAAPDETSGDGSKKGVNYEIKYSGHANKSKMNWVQIRPDHKIHYYILAGYNMYENGNLGKGYIFKVPSEKVYELIPKYGGYAHGTIEKLGAITCDNIKGRHCEYALRCNPNIKKGKGRELWDELLKYEVEYSAENF